MVKNLIPLMLVVGLAPAVAWGQTPVPARTKASADMYGAIAYGKSSLRYGYSFDAGSRYDAESRALSECGAADCAVVVWFVNACGALARSTHGQIGWGWAATREQAESIALGYCEKESGGRYPCSVLVWACTSR